MVCPFDIRGSALSHGIKYKVEKYVPDDCDAVKSESNKTKTFDILETCSIGMLKCFKPVRVWSEMGTVTTMYFKVEPLSCNSVCPDINLTERLFEAHILELLQMFLWIDCMWYILVLIMVYLNRLPCRKSTWIYGAASFTQRIAFSLQFAPGNANSVVWTLNVNSFVVQGETRKISVRITELFSKQ